MNTRLESLLQIVHAAGISHAKIIENNYVQIKCQVNTKPLNVNIYYDKSNMEIVFENMLTIDRIENQNLELTDVIDLLTDFLENLNRQKLHIQIHSLLGQKAYTLQKHEGDIAMKFHDHYESLLTGIVTKYGKSKLIGNIEPN